MSNLKDVWYISFVPMESATEPTPVTYGSYAEYKVDENGKKVQYLGATGISGYATMDRGMHHRIAQEFAKASKRHPDLEFRLNAATPEWLQRAFLQYLAAL